MKKFFLILCLCSIMLSGCVISWDNNEGELQGKLIQLSQVTTSDKIAELVEPAIVGVSGTTSSGESIGSGVCVAEGGYVLTNSHVVSGCRNITLHLNNNTTSKASIIYEDSVNDLAILKSNKSIPYLKLGSSDDLVVGQDILAVGTPLSLSLTHTFTKGIVSAVNRTLKVDGLSGEGYMQNMIQHDASLNPGNSGGPLLNLKGEVVGINTLKISGGEGIGFAIPSKSFKSLLNSFVDNINYELPYLGVYGFDSQIAHYYDSSIPNNGFYVIDVSTSSPLQECGVMSSSVITKLNGRDIKNVLDLKDELYTLDNHQSVNIEFLCQGELVKTKTKLS